MLFYAIIQEFYTSKLSRFLAILYLGYIVPLSLRCSRTYYIICSLCEKSMANRNASIVQTFANLRRLIQLNVTIKYSTRRAFVSVYHPSLRHLQRYCFLCLIYNATVSVDSSTRWQRMQKERETERELVDAILIKHRLSLALSYSLKFWASLHEQNQLKPETKKPPDSEGCRAHGSDRIRKGKVGNMT